jgi:DNA-directed RNA polymerase delta subunit
MTLKDYSKDELETMGYDEIAYMVLKEAGEKMKLQDIFKKVCEVLDYDLTSFQDHITDFFELLSTNKKFIMLEKGYWDLQVRHKPEIVIEENDEDLSEAEEETDEKDEEIPENDDDDSIFYDGEETDDVPDDDLDDLVVVDEDEDTSL